MKRQMRQMALLTGSLTLMACAPPLSQVRFQAKTVSKKEALDIADNGPEYATEVLAAMVSGRPLHCDKEMVAPLLDRGANALMRYNEPPLKCPSGAKATTPFEAAALCCETPEVLEVLLERGTRLEDGNDVAMALVEELGQQAGGNADVAKELPTDAVEGLSPIVNNLAALLSDRQMSFNGTTGLHWLISKGIPAFGTRIPYVRQIVYQIVKTHGVNPDELVLEGHVHLLSTAVNQEEIEVAIGLLDAGADPNIGYVPSSREDEGGYVKDSLLLAAARHGHEKLAMKFIEKGANIRARYNFDSKTVLHYAFEQKMNQLSRMALAHGADPMARDKWGKTPLHVMFIAHPDWFRPDKLYLFTEMVKHGADPNVTDDWGNTPLHYAVRNWGCGWVRQAISTLVSLGARIDIRNKKGKTAVDEAMAKKCAPARRQEILQLLQGEKLK